MTLRSTAIARVSAGREVEQASISWLLRHSASEGSPLILLDKNFRCKEGELDLVLREESRTGPNLVVVEVRGRSACGWVTGVESVTYPKRRRIERATRHYLLKRDASWAKALRFDVLAWNGESWLLVKDAWRAGD